MIDIGAKIDNKLNVSHIWHIREFGDEDYNLIYYYPIQKACNFICQYSEKTIFIS